MFFFAHWSHPFSIAQGITSSCPYPHTTAKKIITRFPLLTSSNKDPPRPHVVTEFARRSWSVLLSAAENVPHYYNYNSQWFVPRYEGKVLNGQYCLTRHNRNGKLKTNSKMNTAAINTNTAVLSHSFPRKPAHPCVRSLDSGGRNSACSPVNTAAGVLHGHASPVRCLPHPSGAITQASLRFPPPLHRGKAAHVVSSPYTPFCHDTGVPPPTGRNVGSTVVSAWA